MVVIGRWCGHGRRFDPRLEALQGVQWCSWTANRPVTRGGPLLSSSAGRRRSSCRHRRRRACAVQRLGHGFRLDGHHQSVGRLTLSFPLFGRLTPVSNNDKHNWVPFVKFGKLLLMISRRDYLFRCLHSKSWCQICHTFGEHSRPTFHLITLVFNIQQHRVV